MRVLVAPQEFRESLRAVGAANAIGRGFQHAHRDWTLDLLPMSDGGPGLIDVLRRAVPAVVRTSGVHDANGRRVRARYLQLIDRQEVVIEAAQANGLWRIAASERDALRADSCGVGELMARAADRALSRLVIGVGGSATTDGGAGMARALGARFLSADGEELPPGGGALVRLARIEWRQPPSLAKTDVVVATDVTNPLLGANGAAAVFAPQKGAKPGEVQLLEAGLSRYAAAVRETTGIDLSRLPGAGAAGGLAGGLVAFLGARLVSGFDFVAEAVGLEQRMMDADAVVTGEGSYDGQSLRGKVTGRIADMARRRGKPLVIFAGRTEIDEPGVHTLRSLEPDPILSMQHAGKLLAELAYRWAKEAAFAV